MKALIKRTTAFIILLATLGTVALSLSSCVSLEALVPNHMKPNLEGYELVFYDEFEGDSLDLSAWEYRGSGTRRGGFNHPDQVCVRDGNLVMTAEYTVSEYGEGWHTGMIRTIESYTQGYFEIRCLPNTGEDFWSAFWLTTIGVYDHDLSQGGIGGAELDIFETYKNYSLTTEHFATSSVHCNGSDDVFEEIDSLRVSKTFVPNLRSEYHTFSMMWNEEEYIFYIDGIETGRTSFGKGVSQVPEYVIVSLEINDEITVNRESTTEFLVDYVKIYQLKQ